jgi:hypothetical protein
MLHFSSHTNVIEPQVRNLVRHEVCTFTFYQRACARRAFWPEAPPMKGHKNK